MDKTSWPESLESLQMRKRAVLGVVGHFPSPSMVKMHNIQNACRLIIFSVFRLGRNPILIGLLNFPACFATVEDRLAMCGRARA